MEESLATVKPKKQFGQNFLTDLKIAQKIVHLLQPVAGESIIEIGPGKGILSQFLQVLPFPFHAIELDPEAIKYLQQCYPNIRVHRADILAYRWEQHAPFVLISNLPYHISSPVCFKILEHRDIIRQVVIMLQREVAQRICSPPNSKEYGILSVLLGYYYDCKYAFKVSAGSFFPKPKVESAVVVLTRKEIKNHNISFKIFVQIVKVAFGHRRKTLYNNFKGTTLTLPEEYYSLRAEQLSIEEFVRIAEQNV